MFFSHQQVQDLLDIIRRQELIFIASQLGVDYLTDYDKQVLEEAGIDLDQFVNSRGVLTDAFAFGVLADAIGSKRAEKMDYNQFKKFVSSKNYIPLTEAEELALSVIKNRAYNDITALGSRMRAGVGNILHKESQRALSAQKMIREKTVKAIELRMGAPRLAAELAEASQNWDSDWLRISYYLTHEAYNTGRSQSILKRFGQDAEVYFDVYKGACKHCKRLFLEDPGDENSRPIVFKLKDILSNGNNIGRKVVDYLPTVSPIHPWCRCTINYKRPDMDWDEELRSFSKPIRKVSRNKKLQGVKLDIKIKK